MKIVIPLVSSIFLFYFSNAQPVGGWGTCEFPSELTLKAFIPSDAFACKKAFVQANNTHYIWNGSSWINAIDSTNIYNSNGALLENRVVDLNSNSLTFDGSSNDIVFQSDGNIGIGTSTPVGQIEAVNNLNVNAFMFRSNNGTTGEKDVFTIRDDDVGGGGQDRSSVLKVHKNAAINNGDDGFSLIETTYSGTALTTDNKYWISGRSQDEGLLTWGVNIRDNEIWSTGGILLNASTTNSVYSGGDFVVESDGDVGIGTNAPATRLEVDGGTVRFSDYGLGNNTGDETHVLAVKGNGDIVEMNTVKSSKTFYPPAIAIVADAIDNNLTIDLHQQYVDQFGSPAIVSSGAPSAIPTYSETELYYYITDYDTTIFENVSINANGVMEYDVIKIPTDNCSFINVVFVVK